VSGVRRTGDHPALRGDHLDLPAEVLYDELYCLRGEAENRIKKTQLNLFCTRASCYKFHANWLRLMFAAPSYTLIQRLRIVFLRAAQTLAP